MNLDQSLFNSIHYLAGKSQILDFLGIFFADYFGFLLVVVAVYLIFSSTRLSSPVGNSILQKLDIKAPIFVWKNRIFYLCFICLALIFSRGIITEIIRFFYYRPRPFTVLNFSPLIGQSSEAAFPSGHMAVFFVFAFLIFFLNKKWGWYAIGAAAFIGLARVFVGVHWPMDILGGAVVAFVSIYITDFLFKKFITGKSIIKGELN